jgi:hypothetical protein
MTPRTWSHLLSSWRVSRQTLAAMLCLALLSVGVLQEAVRNPAATIQGIDLHVHQSWESVNRLAHGAGHRPYWNPYSFSGYPSMADIQTQAYYPPSMALRWLPVPGFFTWGLVFHLWVLGVGVFAVCRQAGTGRLAGVAAAAGVVLSGAIVPKIYAGHIVVLYGYAWFPLALALAIRSTSRCTIWPHPALVGVLFLHLLAGFLQGTVYVCGVLTAYFVFAAFGARRIPEMRWRLLCQPVLLFLLAFGLAAFQLVPTVRLILEAGRASGGDYAFASENAFTFDYLVTAVFPNAMGLEPERWDSSLFLTIGLLVCAPLAWVERRGRRVAWFACWMAFVALGFAMADVLPLYRLHYLLLPQFRAPTRLLFFFTVGVAVLGGLGLDMLVRRPRSGPSTPVRWAAWVPAVLGGLLVLGLAPGRSGGETSLPGLLGTPTWVVVVLVVLLPSFGMLAYQRRAVLAGTVMVLLVAVEGLAFAAPLVSLRSAESTDLPRLVARAPTRVLSLCEHVISATELITAGIPTTDGFGSISLDRYTRYLTLVQTGAAGAATSRLGGRETLPVRMDLVDALNVSHVITCEPADTGRLDLVGRLNGAYLYENTEVRPRAVLTCATEPLPVERVMRRLARSTYDRSGRLLLAPPVVSVRWAEGTAVSERQEAERRLGLSAGTEWGGRTWRYDLADESKESIGALLREPMIEDTNGIDRATGVLEEDLAGVDEPSAEWSVLADTGACDVRGAVTVATMNRADGLVRLLVDASERALVFFSEPYYPERRVWVDDVEQPLVLVNTAFAGVQVEPGRHVVELRFVPTAQRWGSALSVLTLVGWVMTGRWWQRAPFRTPIENR